MSRKRHAVEKVSGTVEVIVKPELETFNGFTSEECLNAIQSASMRKKVEQYAKAVGAEETGKWAQAIAISEMTVAMRAEFGTDANLAQFLGLKNKGVFSKMQRAGEFAKQARKAGFLTLPPLSTVTEILAVTGKKYGEQNLLDVVKYISENEMTKEEARDYIKGFLVDKSNNEDDVVTKQVENNDTDYVIEHDSLQSEYEGECVSDDSFVYEVVSIIGADAINDFRKLKKKQRSTLQLDIEKAFETVGIKAHDIFVRWL